MISQVLSLEPSLTNMIRLLGDIRPSAVMVCIFSSSLREVSGKTSSSL